MESIAIIGIGCRFPGANNPDAFWELLQNGVDAIALVPKDRWDVDAFYDPIPATPGKMNTRWGGFLEQVDRFDPSFFEISPEEAKHIDPQQRLVLEVAWEAIENAGLLPDKLAGTSTGVFVGLGNYDYHRLIFKDSQSLGTYSATGGFSSIAANRLSYLLQLQGPSMVIDTACSSSLVALHYACKSLQTRETNLCFVGGVSLILSPEPTISYSQSRLMAVDGRCKTFDASADGYVRGEGCGVVILKRLSDALRDGDNIQAIVRGSAVNQNGLSNGLTVPNGLSQQAVIRQALENAKVSPAQISYVEAHGTGTFLGDAIEMEALKTVLMDRSTNQPCWIGAVKTNIGHLEAASGMASLIKVVLSLQHEKIPPHLHLKQLNRYISLKGTSFSIPTECLPWFADTNSRLAGVSAFGFGGANAHVILEEAPFDFRKPPILDFRLGDAGEESELVDFQEQINNPKSKIQNPKSYERSLHILTLSAKSEEALGELAQRYADFIATDPEVSLADVCFTANTGRSHFNHRLAVLAESTQELRSQLLAFAAGCESTVVLSNKVNSHKQPKIAFLFTGQDSQYVDMGRELYETQPTFRASLDRCNEILQPFLEKPLLSILYPERQSGVSQKRAGGAGGENHHHHTPSPHLPIPPSPHLSSPQHASCYNGGNPRNALAPLAPSPSTYTQLALFALEYALVQLWKSWGIEPSIVMGDGVGEYVAACVAGVFSLEDGLKAIASQTDLMPIMPSNVTFSSPRLGFVSSDTGDLNSDQIATAKYWCRHIQPSRLIAAGMKTLHQQGCEVFVEIGTQPILLEACQCLPDVETQNFTYLPSLHPERSPWQQMLLSLAQLYIRGVQINWSGFDQDYLRRRVALPTYPFGRVRYWLETTQAEGQRSRGAEEQRGRGAEGHFFQTPHPLCSPSPLPPRNDLERQLLEIWEKVLGIQLIGVTDNFFKLGGNSLQAVRLFAQIEKVFAQKLPLTTLFQSATVEQLAEILRQSEKLVSCWSMLVPIQTKGDKLPLFCVHGADGNVLVFRNLPHHLDPNQPIYGLQAKGLDGKQDLHTRIEDMAADYIKQIQTLQPVGPYKLAGYSNGGVIAFEMALQLQAQGQKVALLALFDTWCPLHFKPLSFASWASFHLTNFSRLEPKQRLTYLIAGIKERFHKIANKFNQGIGKSLQIADEKLLANSSIETVIYKTQEQAVRNYVPQVYSGRIVIFRSIEQPWWISSDHETAWNSLAAGGLEVYEVPGNHESIIRDNVESVAAKLHDCLDCKG